MKNKYIIIDSFIVNNKEKTATVIVLDRDFDSYWSKWVFIDGNKYSYLPTHNNRWITIWGQNDFKEKMALFI